MSRPSAAEAAARPPFAGSCFGYAVRSVLDLRYLRESGRDQGGAVGADGGRADGGRSGAGARGNADGEAAASDRAARVDGEGADPEAAHQDEQVLEVVVASGPDPAPGRLVIEWLPPRAPAHVRLHQAAGAVAGAGSGEAGSAASLEASGDADAADAAGGEGGAGAVESGAGYRIWIDGAGWFGVEPGVPRITVPADGDPVRREERVWGLPVLLCLLARGDVPLHAAAIDVGGRALLLAAPGRFGKTTLAAAFASAGHRVLAEDLTCLRPASRPGSPPTVIPGPAMLRVRRDVADAVRVPGALELGRDDDRVHLSLERDRGTCAPVPLAGVALLHDGEGEPRVEPAAGADAVRELWTVSFNLPTSEDRERCFKAVAGLASATPIWKLTRRMRLDDLDATVRCLVDAVEREGP